MVDGHNRDAWNHTSHVLAMLFNAHKDPRTRARSANEFHPNNVAKPGRATTLAELVAIGVLRSKPKKE